MLQNLITKRRDSKIQEEQNGVDCRILGRRNSFENNLWTTSEMGCCRQQPFVGKSRFT